jgi:hypothetical protein
MLIAQDPLKAVFIIRHWKKSDIGHMYKNKLNRSGRSKGERHIYDNINNFSR